MDGVQEACEETSRFHDETYVVNHEDQMAGQNDWHKRSQSGRTPFYGRSPYQKEKNLLDSIPFEDANCRFSTRSYHKGKYHVVLVSATKTQ